MPTEHMTRRDMLKILSGGAASLALPPLLAGLAGCSATPGTRQSYITDRVQAENLSTVFIWTDMMLQAIRDQAITPPPATRAFAMAHTAGFLAVNGIVGKYQTPYQLPTAPAGTNPHIAYGSAFSRALGEALGSSFLFDQQRFLEAYADDAARHQSVRYGAAAADRVIDERINDGAEPNKAGFYLGRYPRRTDALRWAPTGPFYGASNGPRFGTFGRGLLPGWGAQKPWVMNSAGQFLARDFPDANSPEFAQQFEKIKGLGGTVSDVRTADETQIAFFWEDGPRGVTPPGHWQLIAMDVIQDRGLPLIEQARLFALLSMAQADAAITTWHSKYTHDIVRPETAIRQRADRFGNPALVGQRQADWTSLIPTPGFPAYTSGHSTFSAASARMIANFIGRDDVRFSSASPDLVNWPEQLTGVRRSWSSLWQAAEEAGASRLYGGIHWDADNDEALDIGRELADYVFAHAIVEKV